MMETTGLSRIAEWMPRQRWYTAKGRVPALRVLARCEHPSDDPAAEVRTLLLSDERATSPAVFQVPVVARAPGSRVDPAHVIGALQDGTILVDGPRDPAYTDALAALVTGRARLDRSAGVRGLPATSGPPVAAGCAASVLIGEQSNTSIVYRPAGTGPPVICKVFRQVHAGVNPDIELQTALAAAGSRHVPRAVGSVEGEWTDAAGGRVTGSWAFAQEFFSDAEDAWRVSLRAAADGEDVSASARELGAATADVHADLARLFPSIPSDPRLQEATVATWRQRLRAAEAEVPRLSDWATKIQEVYRRAFETPWPDLQRIHGDYHLGQVLRVPRRGWVLVDFEGEPLRPIGRRREADLAARDVAGMLRSFDYVAGSVTLDQGVLMRGPAHRWARRARKAFLAGYADRAGSSPAGPLLDALELDKAVYETLYEARSRPDWITIPLDAVERLARRGG